MVTFHSQDIVVYNSAFNIQYWVRNKQALSSPRGGWYAKLRRRTQWTSLQRMTLQELHPGSQVAHERHLSTLFQRPTPALRVY